MNKPRVLITHTPSALANYFGQPALAELRTRAELRCHDSEAPWTAATLAQAARGMDIIVSDRRAEGSAELLAQLPQLVAFCRCAVDVRNVDIGAASAAGILVTHASPGFMASVSEWIVGVMIDLSRHISASVADYRAGRQPTPRMGRELRGSTLGIIGYGYIGRYVAELGLAMGMRVLVHDPFVQPDNPALPAVPLTRLLQEADHVVCLAVANDATENLLDAAAFAAMKPGAFFINASRGNLVDEAALLIALDRGQLGGCALDVGRAVDQMPPAELARHPLVLATPHIGGLTPQAIEHQALEVVQQVGALATGRVPEGTLNAAQASRLQGFFARMAAA